MTGGDIIVTGGEGGKGGNGGGGSGDTGGNGFAVYNTLSGANFEESREGSYWNPVRGNDSSERYVRANSPIPGQRPKDKDAA